MESIPSDFFVERADFQVDHDAIGGVRETVFQREQKVPAELMWDAADRHAVLVLARDLEHRPIGTGRLTADHRIGRMAVLPEWRGHGVGSAMLAHLLDAARQRGDSEVTLHSQLHAVPFYQAHGFEAVGEVFEEAGISHQNMRLPVAPAAARDGSPHPRRLESEVIELQSVEDCRRLALQLLQQARHQVWIYTRDLDPEVLHGAEMVAELRRIATSSRRSEVRVLVQDVAAAQQGHSPLLDLAQRLSSRVLIQQPEMEVEGQYPGAFLLNDVGGWLSRPLATRFEGEARLHAPGSHRQWLEHFQRAWDRSRPVSELRAQGL